MSILAVDIGGTSVKYGIWHEDNLLERSKFKTPNSLENLKIELCRIKKEMEDKNYKLEGAAFSCPGVVNKNIRMIKSVSMVPYIHNNNIYDFFEDIFKVPVTIENDANCVALAELWKGNEEKNKNILFVIIGSGIGGAVVWDGKLQKGKNLYCGEFGFMIIEKDKILSQLGTAVSMAQRYSIKKEKDGTYFSAEEVFDFAEKGDLDAKEEVEKFYNYLSIGIWNLQFIFDPEKIILGGSVTGKKDLIDQLNVRLDSIFSKIQSRDNFPNIEISRYRGDANLVGAVANFMEEYKNNRI